MSEIEQKALEQMRHTASHVLALAVLRLYPDTKLGIGPAIENGFYYDFEFSEPITEEDLPKIEKEMKRIIKAKMPVKQYFKEYQEAVQFYKNWEQEYKLDLIKEIDDEKLSFFSLGDGEFTDLCRGPHLSNTGKVGKVKLLSIAGAYWRGDEKNKMLTRIYGTNFPTKEQLNAYLESLKIAEEKNHRKIGKEMELFTIFNEVGQGLPIWLPNGYAMRRTLEDYMIKMERRYGYVHCLTPHINKEALFKTSGHLDFYKDSMYAPLKIDGEKFYLKPMNCPTTMMIYKMGTKSYRDLPYKIGEFGTVYRYEKSGELHGLQRVRGFTQNDAHIFCTPEQLEEQFLEVLEMLEKFYKDLGFDNYKYRLSLSDPEADKFKFCGSREDWDRAEQALRDVLIKNKVQFYEAAGEAAFYGPKLDVQAVNIYGKEDTISTIQVDFNLPERFDISYVDSDGQKQRPFVIHRALIGSFERFFAFLIEYYGGNFPLWLAPNQVRFIPVSAEKHTEYLKEINEKLLDLGISASVDDSDDTMQSKIRQAELDHINYIIVAGDKEMELGTVSVRPKGGKNLGMIKKKKFLEMILMEIQSKGEYMLGQE